MKKEENEGDQIEKVSNWFNTISISENLQSLNIEENLDKQKADALVIDEATIGDNYVDNFIDVDNYIDESNLENML